MKLSYYLLFLVVTIVLCSGISVTQAITLDKVNSFELNNNPTSIQLSNNNAFIAGDSLLIVDISNPKNLKIVSNYSLENPISCLKIKGNYAYATSSGKPFKLITFDITNSTSVKKIAEYTINVSYPSKNYEFSIDGNYLYLCTGVDRTIHIFDISIPSTIKHVGTFDIPIYPGGNLDIDIIGSNSISIINNYAYISSRNAEDGVITVVDISNSTNPKYSNYFRFSHTGACQLLTDDDYLWINNDDLLLCYNITNPLSIKEKYGFNGLSEQNYYHLYNNISAFLPAIIFKPFYNSQSICIQNSSVYDIQYRFSGSNEKAFLDVYHKNSGSSTHDIIAIQDNRLRKSNPTSVLRFDPFIGVGSKSTIERDLILFDLSKYPKTTKVNKATLSLYWYYPAATGRKSDTVVEIYRPVNWDPVYTTWNNRLSGVPWVKAGGNWYDKKNIVQGISPYATITIPARKIPDNKYYNFDVTNLVQDYVSGKYANTGFFIKAKHENTNNYIAFYSSEVGNALQKPKLTITTN